MHSGKFHERYKAEASAGFISSEVTGIRQLVTWEIQQTNLSGVSHLETRATVVLLARLRPHLLQSANFSQHQSACIQQRPRYWMFLTEATRLPITRSLCSSA